MAFNDSVSDTTTQWKVFAAAPIPFLVLLVIVSAAIWWTVSKLYSIRISNLNSQINEQAGRLTSRDEEIESLKKLVEENAIQCQTHPPIGIAFPPAMSVDEHQTLNAADEINWSMPWRVNIKPEDRNFTDFNALLNVLKANVDSTTARISAQVKPYLRKWVTITIEVEDVDERDEETCISSRNPCIPVSFIWMHFTNERDGLTALGRGDRISLVGWVAEARLASIRLYGCELVP